METFKSLFDNRGAFPGTRVLYGGAYESGSCGLGFSSSRGSGPEEGREEVRDARDAAGSGGVLEKAYVAIPERLIVV